MEAQDSHSSEKKEREASQILYTQKIHLGSIEALHFRGLGTFPDGTHGLRGICCASDCSFSIISQKVKGGQPSATL